MDLEMLKDFEEKVFNPLKHLGFKLKEMSGGNMIMGSSGLRKITGIGAAKKFGGIGIHRFKR